MPRAIDPNTKPQFFVLRAKGKELMLKMYDMDPESQAKLASLKRRNQNCHRSKERSKMIRVFIKSQLTSGASVVYAYRDTKVGAWVKTSQAEAEKFRRDISPVSNEQSTER